MAELAIVAATDVRKTYDTGSVKVDALQGIDLTVDRGEMVAALGFVTSRGGIVSSQLEVLSHEECLAYLRSHTVGRVAFVPDDGVPMTIPVNYRLVDSNDRTWVAIRTRPGNVLDRAEMFVAFEIDQVDEVHHEGWSVVVRGTLHHIDPDAAAFRERFDPEPWVVEERDSWLAVDAFAITGRSLHAPEGRWAFDAAAYL